MRAAVGVGIKHRVTRGYRLLIPMSSSGPEDDWVLR